MSPIAIGSGVASDVRLGANSVSAVYWGTTKIWPPLPAPGDESWMWGASGAFSFTGTSIAPWFRLGTDFLDQIILGGGGGGAGAGVGNSAGSNGGTTTVNASGGLPAFSAAGGTGGPTNTTNGQNGLAAGNHVWQGITYVGGTGNSNAPGSGGQGRNNNVSGGRAGTWNARTSQPTSWPITGTVANGGGGGGGLGGSGTAGAIGRAWFRCRFNTAVPIY